jgi:MSHA biogenesis protein MshL
MPTLPLSQIDDRLIAADLDNRTFSLTLAQPVPIQELLLLLVRGTNLSVIPDPTVGGSFVGDLKNVTVRQALNLILQPLGLDYSVAGGFIRVFRREPETRIYDINYIASQRTGTSSIGTGARDGRTAQVTTVTTTDLFADITKGVQSLLSERATFNVDRKAGLLQVVDFPERLDRIGVYLDAVHDRVQRQVRIDVKVVEVELNDANGAIDWIALAGAAAVAGPSRSTTGLRIADVPRLLAQLAREGIVSTLADPRILVLNNEPAIVRAGSRRIVSPPRPPNDPGLEDEVALSVTPHIAPDGIVMLSLSPILTRSFTDAAKKDGETIVAADTLARVADGETIALAGFVTDRYIAGSAPDPRSRNRQVPVMTKKRTELLILLTPKVLNSAAD